MRRRIAGVVVVLLLVAVVLACALAFPPWWRVRCAQSLMARYAVGRDQHVAQRLAWLLDRQSVSPELGNRILKVLMMPEVSVRDAYGSDRPVYIATRYPLPFELRRTRLLGTEYFYAGGEELTGSENAAYRDYQPRCHEIRHGCLADGSVRQTNTPGVHMASIRYSHVLVPEHSADRKDALHRCESEIPLTIHVVNPDEAEPIRLVSNPSLEKRMKAAFRFESCSPSRASWPVGDVRIEMSPSCHQLFYSPLPENVASRFAYRDETGLEIPLPNSLLLQRAGWTWGPSRPEWVTAPSFARVDLPDGKHKGTLVLTPDIDTAYRDPEIKTLYDGTLEFPIEFDVTEAKK